jgi:hypothetical protein
MKASVLSRAVIVGVIAIASTPAFAQVELNGSYSIRMYEDYIERGPGSFLGDFTGMPMSDEGRAKALLYTSNLPSTIERQCLAQSPWVGMYRPLGLRIYSEVDDGRVVAWVLAGDYLRDTVRIWMDGRPHPSANAWHPPSGFSTGHWEGDTLVVRTTHVKTAWIRRGVGIPGSDRSEFTALITRHDNLLTITTIQDDPIYLTEPHVVSRVWEFDPNGSQAGNNRNTCNVGNELPALEDTGKVPHYLHGQNPEEDYMVKHYNIPKDAALGFAYTLYPEYRKMLRGSYKPPTSCDRYCCGWIERQGLPGAAPGLTCNDGNLPRALRDALTNPRQPN